MFGYTDVRYQMSIGEDRYLPDPRSDGQPYRVEGFRDREGKPVFPFDRSDPAALDAARPDGTIWPRELQSPGSFIAKGRITNFDFPPEDGEGDFFDFKKLNLAVDWRAKYLTPSPTLRSLIRCYGMNFACCFRIRQSQESSQRRLLGTPFPR